MTPGDPCKFILPWSSSPQIASLLCAEASCFEVFEPSDDFEPDLSVANVKASRKQALTQREKKVLGARVKSLHRVLSRSG